MGSRKILGRVAGPISDGSRPKTSTGRTLRASCGLFRRCREPAFRHLRHRLRAGARSPLDTVAAFIDFLVAEYGMENLRQVLGPLPLPTPAVRGAPRAPVFTLPNGQSLDGIPIFGVRPNVTFTPPTPTLFRHSISSACTAFLSPSWKRSGWSDWSNAGVQVKASLNVFSHPSAWRDVRRLPSRPSRRCGRSFGKPEARLGVRPQRTLSPEVEQRSISPGRAVQLTRTVYGNAGPVAEGTTMRKRPSGETS